MKVLHIATLPHGKFILAGSSEQAILFMERYTSCPLDSETLKNTHTVEPAWMVENDIKKVIVL